MSQIHVYKKSSPSIHEQIVVAYTFYCNAADRKSLERLRDEAEEGNLWAAVWLAECYFRGITNDREDDIKKAMKWLDECGNFPLAQFKLAERYLEDEQTQKKGKKLLKTAAEGGLVDAHFSLGTHYSSGRVFKKNVKKATKHFKIASAMGHPDANKQFWNLEEKAD
ncbi:tetratricopeptide repeat protein [Paenibacillus sp. UNC451MF]|uniref:tetratricopeptide repeat protein n=1 Tax=Paenibacillus sp. UNC451MF TaxID=1449063 RepID=UPI00049125D6|nr:SEL1-like repeat protein [Paenibacillus sp. UNC451MF]